MLKFQTVLEEALQFVERNQTYSVIKVHMTGSGHNVKLFRLGSTAIGILAELPGMGYLAGDEEQRPWRNTFDIVERIEVHKLHITRQRRMRRSEWTPSGVTSPRGVR